MQRRIDFKGYPIDFPETVDEDKSVGFMFYFYEDETRAKFHRFLEDYSGQYGYSVGNSVSYSFAKIAVEKDSPLYAHLFLEFDFASDYKGWLHFGVDGVMPHFLF